MRETARQLFIIIINFSVRAKKSATVTFARDYNTCPTLDRIG